MMILGFAGIGFMAYRRKSKPALMAASSTNIGFELRSRLRAAFILEVFAASFASRQIARGVRRDHSTGFAAEVLFQYRESPETAQAQISDNPDLIVSQDVSAIRGLCSKSRKSIDSKNLAKVDF
jgi:hypothetical protein